MQTNCETCAKCRGATRRMSNVIWFDVYARARRRSKDTGRWNSWQGPHNCVFRIAHKIIAVANTNWNKWLTLIAADNKLSDAKGQLHSPPDWQIPSAGHAPDLTWPKLKCVRHSCFSSSHVIHFFCDGRNNKHTMTWSSSFYHFTKWLQSCTNSYE